MIELGPADGKLPSIQVGKLNETEQAELASLVGRKGGVATSITIDVAKVDRALSDAGRSDRPSRNRIEQDPRQLGIRAGQLHAY